MKNSFFTKQALLNGTRSTTSLFIDSFKKRNLLFYVFGIVFTYLIIRSGLDYLYLTFVLKNVPSDFLITANILGFIIPIFLPIILILMGYISKKRSTWNLGWLLARVTFVAFSISTIIKIFTNRPSPPHHGEILDISRIFDFGFLLRSPVGGWPSSHTAVVFALATCIYLLFPKKRYTDIFVCFLALFISVGVTFGLHWLSDFVVGALIGVVVGKEAVGMKKYL